MKDLKIVGVSKKKNITLYLILVISLVDLVASVYMLRAQNIIEQKVYFEVYIYIIVIICMHIYTTTLANMNQ